MKYNCILFLVAVFAFYSCYEAPTVEDVLEEQVKNEWERLLINEYSISQYYLVDYAYDSQKNLYLLFQSGEVFKYDGETLAAFYNLSATVSISGSFKGICISETNEIYVYTSRSFYKYDPAQRVFKDVYMTLVDTISYSYDQILYDDEISSIQKVIITSNDEMWINYGSQLYKTSDYLYENSGDSLCFLRIEEVLAMNSINFYLEEIYNVSNSLWVKTSYNKLYEYTSEGFVDNQYGEIYNIVDVKSDKNDNVVVITNSQKILTIKGDRKISGVDGVGEIELGDDFYISFNFFNLEFDANDNILLSEPSYPIQEQGDSWKTYRYVTDSKGGYILPGKDEEIVIITENCLYKKK